MNQEPNNNIENTQTNLENTQPVPETTQTQPVVENAESQPVVESTQTIQMTPVSDVSGRSNSSVTSLTGVI